MHYGLKVLHLHRLITLKYIFINVVYDLQRRSSYTHEFIDTFVGIILCSHVICFYFSKIPLKLSISYQILASRIQQDLLNEVLSLHWFNFNVT